MESGFSDLFFNPVTGIALVLAVFFSLMALLRSKESRRKEREKNAAKPYTVADPFSAPKAPPAETVLSSSASLVQSSPAAQDSDHSRKYFRQFGPTSNGTGAVTPSNPTGYIWE